MRMPNTAPHAATVRRLNERAATCSQRSFSASWQLAHFGALVAAKSMSPARLFAFRAGFPSMIT